MKVGLEQDLVMPKGTREYYREQITSLEKKVKLLERDLKEAKIVAAVKKKVQKILAAEAKRTAGSAGRKSLKRSKKG